MGKEWRYILVPTLPRRNAYGGLVVLGMGSHGGPWEPEMGLQSEVHS